MAGARSLSKARVGVSKARGGEASMAGGV
jgi:hypothetical protein